MKNYSLLDLIKPYKTISIIGMDKNVGKTTVLNHLIQSYARDDFDSLALTSIGRDGEEMDLVTSTEKPRIYVRRGTLIATASKCLSYGDITKEVVHTTGIQTAMGEVVFVRALSDGYIDLGGPSIGSQIHNVCNNLLSFGANKVIVDGALSRKTFASPSITEATILSSGASLSRNIDVVVKKTCHTVNLLSTNQEEEKDILNLCNGINKECKIALIIKNKWVRELDVVTALNSSKLILDNLSSDVTHVYINGVILDKLLNDLVRSTSNLKNLKIICEDGTKLFIEQDTLNKFYAKGGLIRVLTPINLLCVTCNPKSPYGYEFNKQEFMDLLNASIELPVFDVIGDKTI